VRREGSEDGPPERLFHAPEAGRDAERAPDTERAPDAPDGRAAGAPGKDAGTSAPLPARIRPTGLEDFVGQEHVLGDGSSLRSAIERCEPHSMILHGPPGSGKTTLARMFASCEGWAFEEHSAVQVGLAEVRAVIVRARARLAQDEQAGGRALSAQRATRTVFFLDEIHRFNKTQQDALLPAVEDGLVTLIGATTENPAFEIVGALLSRMRVYALQPLTDAEGDARVALGGLELADATARRLSERRITRERAADVLQRRTILYDRAGDRHYDFISAWIKATRGSDPDASLYSLAVMLEGGEDPRFVARRMIILASEDIGNADPGALPLAVAAAAAVEHVGMPEARYALAQAAVYLALAPKSNAAGSALRNALRHVRERGAAPVPPWLLSGPRPGRGQGGGEADAYDYPHEHPGQVSPQELMPERAVGARFYVPRESEPELERRLAALRRARGRE
jgi:putative ATPase